MGDVRLLFDSLTIVALPTFEPRTICVTSYVLFSRSSLLPCSIAIQGCVGVRERICTPPSYLLTAEVVLGPVCDSVHRLHRRREADPTE